MSDPLDTGDFRLMSRRIAELVAQMPERDRFIRGMVASVGFKQVPFLYDRCERFAGTTKYPITKMIKFAADAFFGYSMVLLRFSSIAALGLLVTLVAVAAYSLYAWAIGQVVPGWTSIMMMVILVAFFQLVALSVIGEYVGRIYLSTKSVRCSSSTGSSAAWRTTMSFEICRARCDKRLKNSSISPNLSSSYPLLAMIVKRRPEREGGRHPARN